MFRTEKRRSPTTGLPYPWIVRSSAMVNHHYIYAVDRDFGPFFLKFCSYFPFNAKLCLNGHEYARCQLAKEGIAFEALDNGVLSCADPARLQKICDGLSGRQFFEQVIRENLDLGRPEQVQLIFKRRVQRNTPGQFRTRILTQEVTPSLNVYYKNTRIKQYHKESRSLRTETTINNTRDFGVGKRLCNLPALRAIGFAPAKIADGLLARRAPVFEVEVRNPSILKTEHPVRHLISVGACPLPAHDLARSALPRERVRSVAHPRRADRQEIASGYSVTFAGPRPVRRVLIGVRQPRGGSGHMVVRLIFGYMA